MAQSLNMDDYVSPNHWNIGQFEAFKGIDPKQEFELIAPVLIYFAADSTWTEKARAALKKLRLAKHPLFTSLEQPVASILNMRQTPDGLVSRYNALVMWLADDVHPGIESRIDEWGAYAFTVGQDTNVLSGCSSGLFAFFDSFEYMRTRIQDAVFAAEDSEAIA